MKPTLVVLAAGMGSRYGSLKQVDGLGPNGETIIDYSAFDALRAGFGKVVFIIRKSIEADFVGAFAERFKGKVPYEVVFQELDMLPEGFTCPADRTKPWGTAHAVWAARNAVNEPFAVINADDFYGADSFQVMAKALSEPNLKPGTYFMVGYRLGNTLSEEGSVSRGVCSTNAQSYLETVVERTKIQRVNGTVCYTDENGNEVAVDENLPVSMNFWGFTPDYFEHTERMFSEFLKTSIDNPKSEFYIPLVVNTQIESGSATCKVLPTSAEWFGVTYPGDKPIVVSRLAQLAKDGIYPSPLW
ncbi:MAG: nucleotidyltransferase [Bacteroidales bacterium]|jgi:hypothetical protein|nr:nucleotidyltransferase [Bacteroidales bacterium]MBN2748518.1 nucleotidyltransferase [Bacteroidales bacterium]